MTTIRTIIQKKEHQIHKKINWFITLIMYFSWTKYSLIVRAYTCTTPKRIWNQCCRSHYHQNNCISITEPKIQLHFGSNCTKHYNSQGSTIRSCIQPNNILPSIGDGPIFFFIQYNKMGANIYFCVEYVFSSYKLMTFQI